MPDLRGDDQPHIERVPSVRRPSPLPVASLGRCGVSAVLAIDPGPTESGWALIDSETCEPIDFGKTGNAELMHRIYVGKFAPELVAIEMVASYGMSVGAEVFETCVWIGRFDEALREYAERNLIYRRDVKLHHCGQTKATDANIAQALKDRFAPGQRNHGKGTKAAPGFFYGFRADIWQAFALAVLAADRIHNRPGVAT